MKKRNVFEGVMVGGILILGWAYLNKGGENLELDNKPPMNNPANYLVYEKKASIEGKDGWYYYFYLNGVDNITDNTLNVEEINYFFNAINLKYETLPDYGFFNTFINDDGKEEKTFISEYPSLTNSLKEKNGVKEHDEMLKIDDFFDKKQFKEPITIDDLKDLTLENFDKELIVNLYNKMLNQEYDSTITDFTVYPGEYRQDEMQDGYKWHTSLLSIRTGVLEAYIDIIYEDGTYLSDLIASNKASLKQQKLYANMEKISKFIVENQTVDLDKSFKDLSNNSDYQRLFKILATYDDGWIK